MDKHEKEATPKVQRIKIEPQDKSPKNLASDCGRDSSLADASRSSAPYVPPLNLRKVQLLADLLE